MSDDREQLLYVPEPKVVFATNTFIDVPVILEAFGEPLIQMGQVQGAGFTTQFDLFWNDGEKLAVVKGSRVFATEAGKKLGLKMEHRDKVTVCRCESSVFFELRRTDAAALKTEAELFAPNGAFVSAAGGIDVVLSSGQPLQIGGILMSHNTIAGSRVGIRVDDSGISIGCN